MAQIPDIRFEQASILYNIGALHSVLGAADSRTTAEVGSLHHYSTIYSIPYMVNLFFYIFLLLHFSSFPTGHEDILHTFPVRRMGLSTFIGNVSFAFYTRLGSLSPQLPDQPDVGESSFFYF